MRTLVAVVGVWMDGTVDKLMEKAHVHIQLPFQ